jgi:NADH-quinone oxidoreductase subunit L
MMLGGLAVAWYFYMVKPLIPFGLSKRFRGAYQFLLNAWYFDALYDRIFVRPAFYLGYGLWKDGDGSLIDGVGPDGISSAVQRLARRASALQTGYVYHYAFAMLIGVAGIVTWYLYGHTG